MYQHVVGADGEQSHLPKFITTLNRSERNTVVFYDYLSLRGSLRRSATFVVVVSRKRSSLVGPLEDKACLHFSMCARHPCAGAMLIFSVSFQC